MKKTPAKVLLSVVLALMLISLADAISIGISPTYIDFKDLLRGQTVEGRTLYFPTEKGVELVQIYRRLSEEDFIDAKSPRFR